MPKRNSRPHAICQQNLGALPSKHPQNSTPYHHLHSTTLFLARHPLSCGLSNDLIIAIQKSSQSDHWEFRSVRYTSAQSPDSSLQSPAWSASSICLNVYSAPHWLLSSYRKSAIPWAYQKCFCLRTFALAGPFSWIRTLIPRSKVGSVTLFGPWLIRDILRDIRSRPHLNSPAW